MRLRFIIGLAVFLLAGVTLASVLLGPSLLSGIGSSGSKQAVSAQAVAVTGNTIVRENAQAGTATWQIPPGKAATTQIQAYADTPSVLPGKTLTFYVSTQKESTPYTIQVYRLGWYSGLGGRLMTSVTGQIGHAQGYYDVTKQQLMSCKLCVVNNTTGLIEANWQPSYILSVPSDWTTGIYLAKFVDVLGMQTYVPFDVQGTASSDYVVVTPDTTYAAYNTWGGFDLYDSDNTKANVPGESDAVLASKAVKVSFDRPYSDESGSSQVLLLEADAIRWMEREGYDLSYVSDIDLQQQPALLAQHKAYISIGHDEYWTKEMRDTVEGARDKGMSLAFLGADTAYWQIRLEPDSHGTPDRTVVCYKVSTSQNDLARDPYFTKDPTRLTAAWRDPALARPEDAMVGIMYSGLTLKVNGFPWHVNPKAISPVLKEARLVANQPYGCGLVGYEWDRAFNDSTSPKNLHILGITSTSTDAGMTDKSNTTYYTATSGAIVFASGSLYWAGALDSYRLHPDQACGGQSLVVPGIQNLMNLMMNALITHKTP